MNITKTEIKSQLKEELKCPQSFIDRCNKFGQIDELKKAIMEDDRDIQKEVMDGIYESYRDYCEAFKLDYEADNRKLKGFDPYN